MIQAPETIQAPSNISTGEAVRLAVRRGRWTGPTRGLAEAHVQAHVVILPASLAGDFRDFCLRNPQACPLLAMSDPGQAMLASLGDDLDVRGDLPAYQVWRYGELTAEPGDVVSIWRRDLVTFVIASSFAFERVPAEGEPAAAPFPTYSSCVPTATVGPFGGPTMVTMRALRADRVVRAVEVATRLGEAHGLPIHIGNPSLIGIEDLSATVQGIGREASPHELPVFWASASTALSAAQRAMAPLCITNAPGALLVTDLAHRQIAAEPTAAGAWPAAPASRPGWAVPAHGLP